MDSESDSGWREQLHERINDDWLRVLFGGTVLLVTVVTCLEFWLRPFYINRDSMLFQHGGWAILNGADLYVDIWDLKPPLIYFVTVVLAAVSFGNMAVLHVLSVIVSVGVVVAGVTLVGVLTHRLTGDGFASVVAGMTMFVLTQIYAFPFAGIRPKYFAFCCGVGALLLAVEDRPLAAGVVGAMAAGFWQLGAPIALMIVLMSGQRSGWPGVWRSVGGGVAVTAITVAPFVLQGHAMALFVETVVAPLYGIEQYTVAGRLLNFLVEIGYGVAVVPLAVAGWGLAVAEDYERNWWVAVGGGGYLMQLFVEFQGAIELILLFVFFALGVGLLVAHVSQPSRRTVIACSVILLVLTSGYWNFGRVSAHNPPLQAAVDAEYDRHTVPNHNTFDTLPARPEGVPSMETVYWEQRRPDTCHYRAGLKQRHFMRVTDGTLYKSTCGQWPFEQPPRQWLTETVLPVSDSR